MSRLGYNALDAADFRESLLASGVTLRTQSVTIISRITLFLLGTSAALVFLLSEKPLNESND